MSLFSIALRNLWRRPVQSILTACGLAFGLTFAIFMTNFQLGTWDLMVNESVRSVSGHMVVQPAGYQASKDNNLLIENSSAIAQALATAVPEATVLRRAFLDGLLSSPDNSFGVGVMAVEPALEATVNLVADKIVDGEWLRASDVRHVAIGSILARKLEVDVGDKVVLTISHSGEMQALPFRVRGVFTSGSHAMDGGLAYLPLAGAHQLLDADDPANQVAVILDGRNAHKPHEAAIRTLGARFDGVEVLSWEEAMPDLKKQRELDIFFAQFMWPVLAIVVAIGVLNTLLMSLFARTREFGVMLAVGMKPGHLFRLITLEGALLATMGSILGLIGGSLLTWPAVEIGIQMPDFQDAMPVANVALDGRIHATWVPELMLFWAVFFALLATLGAMYPAHKAARTEPIDSLRA